jgi:hypothetical protein
LCKGFGIQIALFLPPEQACCMGTVHMKDGGMILMY